MALIETLRKLRHGPLKWAAPAWAWQIAGNLYRSSPALKFFAKSAKHSIGSYGPFVLDPEFAFSDFSNWGGAHNGGFVECVEACRGAQCVIDVGAHIGLVSLPVSSVVSDGGRVVAFEPSKANYEHLLSHITKNNIDNITPLDWLVGDTIEEAVDFFEMDGATGMNSVVEPKKGEGFARTTRKQTSLDGLCNERGLVPDVIKIDVEGAELAVLNGAREIILKAKPKIFLSVHPSQIAALGRSVDDLVSLVDSLGYTFLEPNGDAVGQIGFSEYLLVQKV